MLPLMLSPLNLLSQFYRLPLPFYALCINSNRLSPVLLTATYNSNLCACGSVHGHLISLTDLDAGTPLYVGDPPVDHLDFVIQFDGGAFREHRVGGAGIVLWKHTTQGLTLLDTFAVPLFPCPDAAYAENVGAARAVLMAARHFPLHRPSRILIKGDNRPIIDFMNSVGKLRRPDLQKLLTEAQHALAFSLPPLIWSYTPREFNKCADFLAGIARDYAKQSLTPDLLPYSLSPFVFPLPPSLSPLYSPPPPLTFSPPSSAFTFQESPDFPISVFPQLARKAAQFPPLQRYLRALQKSPSSIPTISVLYRPTADDQRGRLYPLALGASKLSRHYRALLFGRSHTEIDITGSHYQFFQRFASSLLGISLPSIDQLRHLLKEDFIASNSRFLIHHPTSPKDLPTILLNSSLEATLLHYRGKGYWPSQPIREILHQISQTKPRLLAALNSSLGPRTLSSITSANLFFHTMEHPETLWLKSFTAYILSHHSTASLIWLHDGIWLAPPPPPPLVIAANLHATSALHLGDCPLIIKTRPCTDLYQKAWELFQLPGPSPPDPPPLHSIPPPALCPPLSEVEARRGFQRMMRHTSTTRAPRPIAPSEVIVVED